MLDHYLANYSLNESTCHLHCRDKIKITVLGCFAWRTITGKNEEITVSFMHVGHTRCLVDGHFGLIKKIYHQSDTDTLTRMAEVVQRSSINNIAQLCPWEW